MSDSDLDPPRRGGFIWQLGLLLLFAWGPMVMVIAAGFDVPLWFSVLGWSLIPVSIGLLYWGGRVSDPEAARGVDGTDRGDGQDGPT